MLNRFLVPYTLQWACTNLDLNPPPLSADHITGAPNLVKYSSNLLAIAIVHFPLTGYNATYFVKRSSITKI